MAPRLRSTLLGCLATALVAVGPGVRPASAQYFGRNQVQYKSFDFEVLETEHFDIYFYPAEAEAAKAAGVMAERWYSRLSRLLNHKLRGRQVIIYYASHPDFEQTNAIGGAPGESTGGVTEIFKRRMVLPFAGPLKESDHVLGHEMVHAFQFDMTGQGRTYSEATVPMAVRLPLWFIEGMAEYLSIGPDDPHTSMWIRDAMVHDRLPDMGQLYDPRYFPYRFGQAFWAYIAGRWGDDVVGRILNAAARTGSAEQAMQLVLRVPVDSLVSDWHESIRAAYEPVMSEVRTADQFGTVILSKDNSGGLNTSPVLSPNGDEVVFLSEKDLFAIEMYRADANNGKIEKKIVKTALDGHFESLQFINSAGAWSEPGDRFAFGAVADGSAVITIIDPQSGKKLDEIKVPEVGEIVNPTWSPDSRYIAFTAIVGGLSDLYIYDLESKNLRRVTNDMYADLHPAWSPDGSAIAFVTDRFTTSLTNLKFGNYRLALLDPKTGEIKPVPSFPDAKNINPQWSRDGKSIYFLANPNGITNVYRLELDSYQLYAITDLFTGVSGITALSPALTSASGVDRLAFSAYENGDYNVYTIEDPEKLRGTRMPIETPQIASREITELVVADTGEVATPTFNAGILPPNNRDRGDIEAYLDDPDYGLTDESGFGVSSYKAGLSLDFISQPYLTAGTDRFGTFIGGGASAYWSDMLGRHNLFTQFMIQGGIKDIAAVVAYQNRRSRWNWGLSVGQVPYIQGGIFVDCANQDCSAITESRTLLKQYNRSLAGSLSYPFSRHMRVEFSAGVANIAFAREIRSITTSITGQQLDDQKVDLPAPDPLNLAQASVAVVFDNSFFGATAPILGQRYRFEVAPSMGSLNYVNLLADLRKYFMPIRPFTLAFRLMHYGRYGADAEDPILADLFLGYPSQVRGYDYNSFTAAECIGGSAGCPVYNQLFGSRMIVGNAELRFPLFGALGIGQGMFGVLPVDFLVFGDAGIAWDDTHSTINIPPFHCDLSCREPVYSSGVGLRINLLGFLIAEVDYVKPFQRPVKGAYWQFSFTPGF
jgi:Tol biopolymer transport system component